ncbi:CHAP domain-containing protein [Nocardioides sp. 503]|uniref:CHAP domain-containing protein n=1 Tax=Nocardioides sp. 503 TaxID=2508326 RepID=UPI00106F7334|nr:CHAP domain-containing protein [Nocardioides sp. 503]
MTRTRRLRRALVLGAVLALLAPLGVSSASADDEKLPPPSLNRYGAVEQRASAYLCTGYVACEKAGYSHAGYRAVSDKMYWRMYSGHNCTNYAAYRMVKSGMPNTRPWSGGGNATEWGRKMASITDTTPVVGSIAWWRANAPGTGSSGHVAYVEQVVSATEIVISEDSWAGDFHWRRIRKEDGRWPSGFVHFNDKVLTNTVAPVVTGTPKVGVPLTATVGTWKPAGVYSFQWFVGATPIAGATASRFVPTAAQFGTRVSVRVSARRSGYASTTVARSTAADVAIGDLQVPDPPVVSGVTEVDQVLTATRGSWAPNPSATTVQWYAGSTPIPGATGWTLRLGQAQIDQRISAIVTGRAVGYRQRAVPARTAGPVLAGTLAFTRPFGLTGVPRVGSTLTAAPGATDPVDARVSYRWLRDGVAIPGALGSSYVLTPADIGSQIRLLVRLDRASYRSASQQIATPTRVVTKPVLRIRAVGGTRKAVVVVRVAAPGATPRGLVTVLVGGRRLVGRLVDGRLRAVITDVPAGPRKVRVRYAGKGFVLPAAGLERVRVRR